MLYIIVAQAVIIFFFFLVVLVGEYAGFKRDARYLRVATRVYGLGIIMLELILMSLMIWAEKAGNSINHLLEIHFWGMLIVVGGLALLGLIKTVVDLINPGSDVLQEEEMPKWVK